MKLMIEIDEARFKDIQRIAEVQLEMNRFQTAEQIIAKGVPIEQEPCDDAIRREELLKAMDTCDKFGYTTQYGLERLDKDDKGFVPYVKYDDMVNCVKNMSSVTPQEPKMGHWIHFANSDDCSECGWSTGKYISPSKYCPNCGRRMVEPQESGVLNEDID